MRVREEDERDEEGALALAVEGAEGVVERGEAASAVVAASFSFLRPPSSFFFGEELQEPPLEPVPEGLGVFFGVLLRDGVGDLFFFLKAVFERGRG